MRSQKTGFRRFALRSYCGFANFYLYIAREDLVYRYGTDNAIIGLCVARRRIITGIYLSKEHRGHAGGTSRTLVNIPSRLHNANARRYLSRLGARQASHKYMHNNVTQFILRPTSAQNVPRPGADVILLTAGRSIHNIDDK